MKKLVIFAAMLLLTFSVAQAQNSISLDNVIGPVGSEVEIGTDIEWQLRLTADAGINTKISGYTNGFRVMSPDGATWSNAAAAYLPDWDANTAFDQTGINPFGVDGSGADTLGFFGFTIFSPGAAPGYNQVSWSVSASIANDPGLNGKTICLDSVGIFPPANPWKWNDLSNEIFPTWDGPHCYTITDPNATSFVLVATPSPLNFEMNDGDGLSGTLPISVTEQGGGNIAYTSVSSDPYIVITNGSGSTPGQIDVAINEALLPVGVHAGTVTISSGDADNDVVIDVNAVVNPVLVFSDDTLGFSAQAGGPNPAALPINIALSDGSVQQFTAVAQDARISVNPVESSTGSSVDVSVNIAGLAEGIYLDSVLVFFSPFKSAALFPDSYFYIRTEITAADQKVLQVTPTSLEWSIAEGDVTIDVKNLSISEEEGDVIPYVISDDAPWLSISTVTNMTPEDAEVSLATGLTADNSPYNATITISSPDASNPPIEVPVTVTVAPCPVILASSSGAGHNVVIDEPVAIEGSIDLTSSDPSL
ncbi:MAG: hypothetical protein V3T31_07035, partial [candidate division Zixibacteria bacterium]